MRSDKNITITLQWVSLDLILNTGYCNTLKLSMLLHLIFLFGLIT